MKIAFVGKGGSGKSTLTSLFVKYLQEHTKKNVLAIDADINMNLASLLGVKVSEDILLSRPENTEIIRKHLRGTNTRISDTSKFLPTTPPGRGSNLILDTDDTAIAPFATTVSLDPLVKLMTVGSYDKQGIGQTCYHSHLFTVENLLSHTVTNNSFNVVCDMVAGTDAFAYSMHLQFDAIALIAEPTPESIEVCRLYSDLSKEAGIEQLIWLVGNKIEDEEDLEYIEAGVGRKPVSFIPSLSILKKARQRGLPVDSSLLSAEILEAFKILDINARQPAITFAERLEKLHQLHEKLNEKQWVQQGYGDVSGQIDRNFKVPAELVAV